MAEKLRPPNSHLNSFQDYENSIKTYHSKWINSRENIDQLIISNKAFQKYFEHPTDPLKRKKCAMQYRKQLEQIILKPPETTNPQLPISQRKDLID